MEFRCDECKATRTELRVTSKVVDEVMWHIDRFKKRIECCDEPMAFISPEDTDYSSIAAPKIMGLSMKDKKKYFRKRSQTHAKKFIHEKKLDMLRNDKD